MARQLKAHDKSGSSFFAPTPPLEALRTALSLAATTVGTWKPCRDPKSEERTQILLLDISRAYFNARLDPGQQTYVQLPSEDPEAGHMCAKLLRHMYGTRAAADGWQEEYSTFLVEMLKFSSRYFVSLRIQASHKTTHSDRARRRLHQRGRQTRFGLV